MGAAARLYVLEQSEPGKSMVMVLASKESRTPNPSSGSVSETHRCPLQKLLILDISLMPYLTHHNNYVKK
jgi:hypothetical protein